MRKIEALPCVSLATPYPGTEMWQMVVSSNKIPKVISWESYFHHSSELPNIAEVSREDLINISKKADEIKREYLERKARKD
jgi:hypothetical protein